MNSAIQEDQTQSRHHHGVARDQRVTLVDSRPPSLHLRPVDIRRVAALNLVAGEGTQISDDGLGNAPSHFRHRVRETAATPLYDGTPPDRFSYNFE